MLVLQPQSGAVNVNVTAHAAPGHPDRVPQRIAFPRSVLLTTTSTPRAPVEHVSVPSRSLAPTIRDTIVRPGWTS
jgi:hypothetical protein